jgi:hypothetical protein
MTANETTIETPSPAAARMSRGQLIALWLLYAALAVQVAAWIAVAATTHDIGAAFTQPHPGLRDVLITGGGIWLVQFAAAVFVGHWRVRAGARAARQVTGEAAAA